MGAVGSGIKRNAKDCLHFHGFGSGREGGGWPQKSEEMHRNVIIFMVLEVPGRGAVVSRIIRNA